MGAPRCQNQLHCRSLKPNTWARHRPCDNLLKSVTTNLLPNQLAALNIGIRTATVSWWSQRTIDSLTAGSAVSGAGTRPATWSTNFLPASGSLIASHLSNCGSCSKPRCPRHPQGLRKHRSFDEACYTFARILREPSTSVRQAMCPVSLRPGGRAPLCGWRVPRVLRPSVSPRPT